VPAQLFQIYRSLYVFDKTPLNPKIESLASDHENWRTEQITAVAPYGKERMTLYLLLPKNSHPPYQTIIFFPGRDALDFRSFHDSRYEELTEFLLKTGRAVIFPVYKSTFERGDGFTNSFPAASVEYRDHLIMWAKDVVRSLDYVETRPDLDHDRIGYLGISWGGTMGAIMPALESRIKAVVLVGGGLFFQKSLPEVDQINFLPHVTAPALMLNGRYDFFFPAATSSTVMFGLLGTPKDQKRQLIYEAGHFPPRAEWMKETLAWYDRYLGPVK
jgi:dienelactone hydrolase